MGGPRNQPHPPSESERLVGFIAESMTDGALAHRLELIVDGDRGINKAQARAYVREAAHRLRSHEGATK